MSKIKEENATCIVCGKKYHLCIACERSKATWKSWKMITDTENCYEIYKVLNDYKFNKISKEEARSLLEKLDLKGVDTFKESVKNTIKEIMKRKRISRTEKEKEVTEVVTETKEDVLEENSIIVEEIESKEEKASEDFN